MLSIVTLPAALMRLCADRPGRGGVGRHVPAREGELPEAAAAALAGRSPTCRRRGRRHEVERRAARTEQAARFGGEIDVERVARIGLSL
jgi:hypothetical protein